MFTGIITDVGKVRSIETDGHTRLVMATKYNTADIEIGASIACGGPCLTVVDKDDGWFAVTASAETLSKTTISDWQEGTSVNLERALRVGDEMGGHIVTGHIDCFATVVIITPEGESLRFVLELPQEFARFVAPKGSVTLDGVSLTVNAVDGSQFGVNIIPHTQAVTTFGSLKLGDCVNFEIDVLARYVDRLRETL
jgi:riboflavin synthase